MDVCLHSVEDAESMRSTAVNQDPGIEAVETREWLDSLDYVLQRGGASDARPSCCASSRSTRGRLGSCRLPPTRRTSTRSPPPSRRRFPATRDRAAHQEHRPLERHGDGGAGQPKLRTASAATSRPSPRRRRCTRSASTTSSAARTAVTTATSIFFQGHAAPGHLRARVPRGPARRSSSSRISAASCRPAAGSRPIRTRG